MPQATMTASMNGPHNNRECDLQDLPEFENLLWDELWGKTVFAHIDIFACLCACVKTEHNTTDNADKQK